MATPNTGPLSGRRRLWGLGVLCLALFASVPDTSATRVGLGSMEAHLEEPSDGPSAADAGAVGEEEDAVQDECEAQVAMESLMRRDLEALHDQQAPFVRLLQKLSDLKEGKQVCSKQSAHSGICKVSEEAGSSNGQLQCGGAEYSELIDNFLSTKNCVMSITMNGVLAQNWFGTDSHPGILDALEASLASAMEYSGLDSTLYYIYSESATLIRELKQAARDGLAAFHSAEVKSVLLDRRRNIGALMCALGRGAEAGLEADVTVVDNLVVIRENFEGQIEQGVFAYAAAVNAFGQWLQALLAEGGFVDRVANIHQAMHTFRLSKLAGPLATMTAGEAASADFDGGLLGALPPTRTIRKPHSHSHHNTSEESNPATASAFVEVAYSPPEEEASAGPGFFAPPNQTQPQQQQIPQQQQVQQPQQQQPQQPQQQPQQQQMQQPQQPQQQQVQQPQQQQQIPQPQQQQQVQQPQQQQQIPQPQQQQQIPQQQQQQQIPQQQQPQQIPQQVQQPQQQAPSGVPGFPAPSAGLSPPQTEVSSGVVSESTTSESQTASSSGTHASEHEEALHQHGKQQGEDGGAEGESAEEAVDAAAAPKANAGFKQKALEMAKKLHMFSLQDNALTFLADEKAVQKAVKSGYTDLTDRILMVWGGLAPQAYTVTLLRALLGGVPNPVVDLAEFYNCTMAEDGTITEGFKGPLPVDNSRLVRKFSELVESAYLDVWREYLKEVDDLNIEEKDSASAEKGPPPPPAPVASFSAVEVGVVKPHSFSESSDSPSSGEETKEATVAVVSSSDGASPEDLVDFVNKETVDKLSVEALASAGRTASPPGVFLVTTTAVALLLGGVFVI